MARFDIEAKELERLEQALKQYQGNAENVINDILHNQAGQLIHDEIKRLMPESDRRWNGKKTSAKRSNSLIIECGELSVTVRTKNNWHYLYFPDDGTNTRNHVGKNGVPLEFFKQSGKNKTEDIIDRCVGRLSGAFENAI